MYIYLYTNKEIDRKTERQVSVELHTHTHSWRERKREGNTQREIDVRQYDRKVDSKGKTRDRQRK